MRLSHLFCKFKSLILYICYKFFMESTDLFHKKIQWYLTFSSKLHSFFSPNQNKFHVKLVCFEKALTSFWKPAHLSELKKQKKCELLDFIVAKIVIFLGQFIVSYRALNTKQVVHCDIPSKYWFHCNKMITPVKKILWLLSPIKCLVLLSLPFFIKWITLMCFLFYKK